ncbi:dTDP-4-dehydrorhamnose reductase [Cellulosimicrobium protaetiae]|uniref:dTDP-4-dehydrorhamnose reductase n=1 Tax=Cellulosimicrobium protaetiae TaxID=2587808 RepID=A0A6M5UG98_9MICO|nr:dTDP-4-dehydrorhamnose reductase [Cellulosimicrobium protaetiae]QJW36118.1 dTDP-4-dehydrorhamnose reductase [Cellulosimicrobium protaetiae]
MRWTVTGAGGMLGTDLVALLRDRGEDVRALDRTGLDVTDAAAVDAAVRGADVVVNAAAYTAVDAAEEDEAGAFAVNAVGAQHVARAAAEHGARLVHVSTDYVFDGVVPDGGRTPYPEDTRLAPRSAYGRSKAAGEWAVLSQHPEALVVRTAWLYGAHGTCFPRTIVRLVRERGAVEVVDDQVGQPTWTVDLADLVVRLVGAGAPGGAYHGTAQGQASWWELAREVVATAGLDPESVRQTSSAAFARPAPRPAWSVLGHDALRGLGIEPVGDWYDRWRAAAPLVLAGLGGPGAHESSSDSR